MNSDKMPQTKEEKIADAKRLLLRCEEREACFLQMALEASREGDDEGVWIGMAHRAENNRFTERLRKFIKDQS